jgi:hypothetical protein
MQRRALTVLVLTVSHLCLSVGLVSIRFAAGMARFDTGQSAGIAERITEKAVDVLTFPIVMLTASRYGRMLVEMGTLAEYLLLTANSFLWAILICAMWHVLDKRWSSRP